VFEVAEAYERQRGRSSKLLAPLFVEFVGVQGEVLDVGCGTGALTFAIARSERVSSIVGLDLSEAFVAFARSRTDDPRICFESGDAQNLRFSNASFDQCVALLVMRCVPDAPKAAREMRRVTRPGGIVATAMWDTTGGNEPNDSLSDAALSLDSNAPQEKDMLGVYGTAQELMSLWSAAGIRNIEVKNIVFPCGFESFDDFWQPLTEGQGPAGTYLRRISEDHREALRERLRRNLFGSRTDGPFTLDAKAWAIRGSVP
jgi:ubiquinone/menaquinone biosynthesis C-methylase UbiE